MKNEIEKRDNRFEVEIHNQDEFFALAERTHTEFTENATEYIKQDYTWIERVFGSKGLKDVIRVIDKVKVTEIKKVSEFREQLVDLAQKAKIDALNKKYMVMISAIDAKFQQRLINFFDNLIKELILENRNSAAEMFRNEEKAYADAEEFKNNKERYEKMIAIIDNGTGRYFRMLDSLFNKFEDDMNTNMKKYQKQPPEEK